jgi:hypothetical protein
MISFNLLILFHREFVVNIFQSSTREFWIAWLTKNKEGILFVSPVSMPQKQFSTLGF